jgi:TatD DNase family protein
MRLFDAHCHLHFPQYDEDREAVLVRMEEKQMGAILIGTDLATSRAALELAKQKEYLWVAVGLHPTHEETFDAAAYETLAGDPKVVAIGECGLDYFRSEKSEGQKERFLAQVALAEKVNKPLVIHCRNAHDDMLALLAARKPSVPIVMHFFTGSGELAQKYLELGCYLSFPGPITYTAEYDESIRLCPMDRLLIETDAPFAAPVPYRGKRNEPAYVERVAEKVALAKGISPSQVVEISTINARKVFSV